MILTWFKSRSGHFEAHSSWRLAGAVRSSKSSGRSVETLPANANTRNTHNPVANIISTTPSWNKPSITLHEIFMAISLTIDRHCSLDPDDLHDLTRRFETNIKLLSSAFFHIDPRVWGIRALRAIDVFFPKWNCNHR